MINVLLLEQVINNLKLLIGNEVEEVEKKNILDFGDYIMSSKVFHSAGSPKRESDKDKENLKKEEKEKNEKIANEEDDNLIFEYFKDEVS